MNATIENLRIFLEERDIGGFLAAYETMVPGADVLSSQLTKITQQIFPTVLHEKLTRGALVAGDTVLLWRLVRCGRLLVVDNDLLEGINALLDAAWREVEGPDAPLPTKLLTYREAPEGSVQGRRSARLAAADMTGQGDVVPMRRIVMASAFTLGPVHLSDLMTFRKSVCASSQEREFLQAVRQFFPSLRAYPNVPLRNFMDVDGFVLRLSDRHRRYSWAAQVDVLLCTEDEDPVACFELDSALHDDDDVRERDQLKDELFALAAIPLLRVRADDTANVRAEDFYDLLVADSETLDRLRPRRLRPRRNHDMLVPAEVQVCRSAAKAYC